MYDLNSQVQALQALRDRAGFGAGVTVAVLDGAVDPNHPDLAHHSFEAADTTSPTLHGTAVGTLIAGKSGGVAPQATLIQIPVFTENAAGVLEGCSQLTLARAIRAACDAGAQIINISGANISNTGQPVDEMRHAIDACVKGNIQVVAAVGNDGLAYDTVPACVEQVLAIAAHDIDGTAAAFNNTGPMMRSKTIHAPGVDLPFAQHTTEAKISGSSFAAPVVSGICALIRAIAPEMQLRELQDLLLKSCVPCPLQTAGDTTPDAARRLDLVLLHENLAQLRADPVTPQNFISERKTTMSDIETTHELVKPAGDYAPCPSDIGDVSAPDAGVTPAEAPAEVAPAEVAPAETEADGGTTIALHAGSTPPPASHAGSFMHLAQSDTVRPQHVASNLNAENKVFAFGTIGYDFTNETNRDYFQQAMHPLGEMIEAFKPMIPENEISMARFLAYRDPVTGMQVNMDKSTALTWTLKVDGIPIYAIRPQNQFAMLEFGQLLNFMIGQTGVDESKIADHDTSTTDLMSARNDSDKDKLDKTVDRVSIAGHIVGETRLYNGHVVPVLSPILRGMFSWNTRALCEAALANTKGKTKKEVDEAKDGLHNFLERVYYELRNKGVEPYHRAMNFSATNAQQASEVFLDAIAQNLQLDTISVERSPISRPGSDFWDVVMQFFDPHKRDQEARMMYRYTIDVSGLMPVTFGPLRKWRAY